MYIGAGHWGKNLIRNLNDLGVLRWVCEVNIARQDLINAIYPNLKITGSIDEILGGAEISA